MRATFLQFKEKVKVMKFFQKKTQNQDRFKRLIHRLSEMSDSELTKVEKILDVFLIQIASLIGVLKYLKT